MDKQLKEFFFEEQDRGHLNFERFPEYVDLLHQSVALFPEGDLPDPVLELLETANCISFAHGLKLGLRLKRWANSLSHPAADSSLREGALRRFFSKPPSLREVAFAKQMTEGITRTGH